MSQPIKTFFAEFIAENLSFLLCIAEHNPEFSIESFQNFLEFQLAKKAGLDVQWPFSLLPSFAAHPSFESSFQEIQKLGYCLIYRYLSDAAALAGTEEDFSVLSSGLSALAADNMAAPILHVNPFTFQPLSDDKVIAYRKAADSKTFVRIFRKQGRKAKEMVALYAGEVGAKKTGAEYRYASSVALKTYNLQKAKTAAFVEQAVVFDSSNGKSVPLKDVIITPEMQASKRLAFLKAIEQLAEESNLRWAMLTITLPSEYHPNPASRDKDTNDNKSFNGVGFDAQQKLLSKKFQKIRSMLAKSDIKLSGVRVHEPHADGTPHWHVLFFYQTDEQLKEITRCAFFQFPDFLRIRKVKTDAEGFVLTDKKGGLEFDAKVYSTVDNFLKGIVHKTAGSKKYDPNLVGCQCQLDVGAPKFTNADTPQKQAHNAKISSMSSYVMKYVNKTTVSSSKPMAPSESLPLSLIAANRQTWGIRSVQFFGIPAIAEKWDMLRKVNLKDETISPLIRQFAELAQMEKGKGAYELIKRAGGLAIAPTDSLVEFESIQAKRETRHGETVLKAIGLKIKSGAAVAEQDGLKSLTKSIQTKRAAQGLELSVCENKGRETPVDGHFARQLVSLYITITTTGELGGKSHPNPFVQSTKSYAIQAQRKAATADIDHSHALIAAAGAGKSYTLVERVKYLISQGIPTEEILVFSYTKDSSRDLGARLVKAGVRGVSCSTMHSKARSLIKHLPDFTNHEQAQADLYIEDFLAAKLSEHSKRYYVLVDEAQDLNELNYRFLNYLAKTLYAVGDFRQAIYQFRGARPDLFDGFKNTLSYNKYATPDLFAGLVHDILTTFRNSTAVNAFANAVAYQLDPNAPFTASLDTAAAGAIYTHIIGNDSEEYEAIKAYLLQATKGKKPNAVLCRTKKQLLYIKARLLSEGVELERVDEDGKKETLIELSTIHAAKGLEYHNVVIACGLRSDKEDTDDFPNVAYVAITRASGDLLLTSQGQLPQVFVDALDYIGQFKQ